jgi:hypothetical protein
MVKPYPYSKSKYYAWKYGNRQVKRVAAAKTIQRTFRRKRYSIFLKRNVPNAKLPKYGRRIQSDKPKQRCFAINSNPVFLESYLSMGTLIVNVVPFPQSSATAARLNVKYVQNPLIKGIRFQRTFEMIRNDPDGEIPACPPIVMHWAIVQLREKNVAVDQWENEIANKFFRNFNDSYDRVENFENNLSGSVWNGVHNMCKMNPDGNVNIMTHRKRVLTQKFGVQGLEHKSQPYFWAIDTYIKLDTVFTYSNSDQAYADCPLFEVSWYNTISPTDYPIGYSNHEYVATFRNHTVYYGNDVNS